MKWDLNTPGGQHTPLIHGFFPCHLLVTTSDSSPFHAMSRAKPATARRPPDVRSSSIALARSSTGRRPSPWPETVPGGTEAPRPENRHSRSGSPPKKKRKNHHPVCSFARIERSARHRGNRPPTCPDGFQKKRGQIDPSAEVSIGRSWSGVVILDHSDSCW